MEQQKKHPHLSVLLSLLIVAIFAATPAVSGAFGIFPGIGGRIIGQPILCSGGLMITIGIPRPGNYFIPKGFTRYLYNNYMDGVWVNGRVSTPGIPCNVVGSTAVIPTKGTVYLDLLGTGGMRGL